MAPLFILFAIPFFLLLMGIEWLWSRLAGKKVYRLNDAITNLNIGVGQQAVNLFSKLLLGGIYVYFFSQFALFSIPSGVGAVLLCIVVFDFLFYWAHRWSHTVNFLWGAHVVHHSSEEFNLSVALRQSWFHNLLAFFIFLPVPMLGFEPLTFFIAAAIHTLYQFWIHTEAIRRMPRWFEWIFNSPSHHRVHHGRDPRYIDKNHAGVLILWDRIFGTFQEEEHQPTYGITTPLNSWNPAWANLHYYAEMWRYARQMKRWKDKIRLLFAKPGWLPEEMGGYQAPPPVDTTHEQKYNARPGKWLSAYVAAQFVLILAGISTFMYFFPSISLFYKITFFTILILSTLICGAVMENKKWVYAAEYLRLAVVMASLNTFYYFWYLPWFRIFAVASVAVCLVFIVWFTLSWRLQLQEQE